MTKVALIGYGKMGRTIARLAPEAGATVVSRIDPGIPQADWEKLTAQAVRDAEICIDFSHPDSVVENIRQLTKFKKSVVIGTTGWYSRMETVRKMVDQSEIGAVYAENFSIGMNLFIEIIKEAARLINNWPQYDVGVIESHHRTKADIPSGTALAIAQTLLKTIERKKRIRSSADGQILPEELNISSIRCGAIPGIHSVLLDSPADSIELIHRAHNREGFALGALEAAKWLVGRKGFYHFKETL